LPTFGFDVLTVDAEGKENSRRRHYAHFFPVDLGNGSVMEMVHIPGGTFMMGSPATHKYRRDNESPQHQVTVPAFFCRQIFHHPSTVASTDGKQPILVKS